MHLLFTSRVSPLILSPWTGAAGLSCFLSALPTGQVSPLVEVEPSTMSSLPHLHSVHPWPLPLGRLVAASLLMARLRSSTCSPVASASLYPPCSAELMGQP